MCAEYEATIATLRDELAAAQATITDLEQSRDRYANTAKALGERIDRVKAERDELASERDFALAQVKTLREALELLADQANYHGSPDAIPVKASAIAKAALSAAQPPAAAALEAVEPDDLLVALMAAKRGFLRLSVHHRDDHHAPDDMPTDDVVMDGWMALCRIVTKLRLKRGDSWQEIFQDSPIQAAAALQRREVIAVADALIAFSHDADDGSCWCDDLWIEDMHAPYCIQAREALAALDAAKENR